MDTSTEEVRMGQNGHDNESANYEQELADYLQERIKPGLNRGAIPLLARSIAKEIARRERSRAADGADGSEKPTADAGDESSADATNEAPSAEADEKPSADADEKPSADADEKSGEDSDDEPSDEDEAPPDFEADMRDLQQELGEDWILSFSVHGDDGWLTAEKQDGSGRVEAETAAELVEAVHEGGDRSS